MVDLAEGAPLQGGATESPDGGREQPEEQPVELDERVPERDSETKEKGGDEARPAPGLPAAETNIAFPEGDASAKQQTEGGTEPDEKSESQPPEGEGVEILVEVRQGLQGILEAFEHKLAYDQTKDRMVNRLHDELQGYKSDLLASATLPLINGLIRLHDELGRAVEALRGQNANILEAERVFKLIEGFQSDIEIVLEDNGVSRYEEPEDKFRPRRQQVLKTVPTAVAEEEGRVVERVRPGFERGDRIIRKEKVTVTKLSVPESDPAEPSADVAEEEAS